MESNAKTKKNSGLCECPVSFEELKADTFDFLPKISYVKDYSFATPNILKLDHNELMLIGLDNGLQLQNKILFLQLNSIKLLI